jgi:hypothetical protein
MIESNRILLQLNRAVECANSTFPQERGIAIILFDNLIEVQLYLRAKRIYIWDITTWYKGRRKYNKETRNNTVSKGAKYDLLLKFSKDNKILSEREFETLKFVHKIRNEVYHQGELDELKIDFAIITYYGFLSTKLKEWGSPIGFFSFPGSFPGDSEIDFGQDLSQGNLLDENKKYFTNSLTSIFSKLKNKNNLAEQAISIILKLLKRINWAIKFINENSKSINFYDVLGRYWYLNGDFFEYYKRKRKPKNLDSILILYSFLREYKDKLDDINDLSERQKEGRKHLKNFRLKCKGKYPHWINLNGLQEKVKKFKATDENRIIQNLMDIETKLFYLYSDINEASSDLEGYIEYLSELKRGK